MKYKINAKVEIEDGDFLIIYLVYKNPITRSISRYKFDYLGMAESSLKYLRRVEELLNNNKKLSKILKKHIIDNVKRQSKIDEYNRIKEKISKMEIEVEVELKQWKDGNIWKIAQNMQLKDG